MKAQTSSTWTCYELIYIRRNLIKRDIFITILSKENNIFYDDGSTVRFYVLTNIMFSTTIYPKSSSVYSVNTDQVRT